jgi:hypothetical protein
MSARQAGILRALHGNCGFSLKGGPLQALGFMTPVLTHISNGENSSIHEAISPTSIERMTVTSPSLSAF